MVMRRMKISAYVAKFSLCLEMGSSALQYVDVVYGREVAGNRWLDDTECSNSSY